MNAFLLDDQRADFERAGNDTCEEAIPDGIATLAEPECGLVLEGRMQPGNHTFRSRRVVFVLKDDHPDDKYGVRSLCKLEA